MLRDQGSSIVSSSTHQETLIRRGLQSGVRFDGRDLLDSRDVEVAMERGEFNSMAELQCGNSRVNCSVRGEIVAPYPDRPTDGIIQFNASLSMAAESSGLSANDVVRTLEKAIRESDALDMESLCIVGGKYVWLITCDVRVVDYAGNALDAAIFSAAAAIKIFRKPDVSISNDTDGVATLIIHKSDEREPLPLALHHTPLAVSFAVFKHTVTSKDSDDYDGRTVSKRDNSFQGNPVMLVADPLAEEEAVMDGSIMYSLNGDNELCALQKPGGVSLPPPTILHGLKLASLRAQQLHKSLDEAIQAFEQRVAADREKRVKALQRLTAARMKAEAQGSSSSLISTNQKANKVSTMGGIGKQDEILSWQLLHRPNAPASE